MSSPCSITRSSAASSSASARLTAWPMVRVFVPVETSSNTVVITLTPPPSSGHKPLPWLQLARALQHRQGQISHVVTAYLGHPRPGPAGQPLAAHLPLPARRRMYRHSRIDDVDTVRYVALDRCGRIGLLLRGCGISSDHLRWCGHPCDKCGLPQESGLCRDEHGLR